ncbi:Holliday junction branch migration protein RuvA [Corynebacterium aquatimens]|uniref:Holliday junction branch migration complex subunit RuvA n=1 Tax=Corynebacterium aquatimens TaxID=1190508 RepID=A0A931GXJ4_9CORY|nr:Holliday junction branch migration protein RuvA [Corynebacterium aquatimens]MBG6121724.1 Holliday junction DNA helicase RuvA [Corynebacterium aquatimens]WJY65737.1 Holliday junction ATP-dependent DNA helicase RuvA [Corynebacterium aquatimens]
MIDSVHGEVLSIGLDHAVIECAGVGYRFLATPPTLATLTRGETTRVFTSMVVKDDGVTLYGFADDDARGMFHRLQTVSGLGPKLALAALAVFSPAELATHIVAGDAKTIQSIPGVGKKMAERIALELKDKMEGMYPAEAGTGTAASPGAGAPASASGASFATEQVVEALVGLGFPERSARAAVDKIAADNEGADSSALLRLALNHLGKK